MSVVKVITNFYVGDIRGGQREGRRQSDGRLRRSAQRIGEQGA